MRRARYDHVEIHENSLDGGILIAKSDPDDTYDIVTGSRSSKEAPGEIFPLDTNQIGVRSLVHCGVMFLYI
jgi:hypothetical protein